MAFNLGNFAVQEVLFGIAEDFSGNVLYTLDQLSSASIEVTSDPTEITDKKGNVVKQIFKSKTASFTATSALLSPNILNAGSGSDIEKASSSSKITMPKVVVVGAGKELDITGYKTGTVQVIGLYGNGANGEALDSSAISAAITQKTVGSDTLDIFTAPAAATDAPIQYLVKYDREVSEGIKMTNAADKFPSTVRLTLYVALVDPCSEQPRAAYVYCPSFQADPSMTLSLDSESTTVDFKGNLQVDYCGCERELYTIYIPDENAVISTSCN